jgi:glycosyltransferase involved in cell wall biosynthesis
MSEPLLSILIPTLTERKDACLKLLNKIGEMTTEIEQVEPKGFFDIPDKIYGFVVGRVQVVVFEDKKEKSIGEKRNRLAQRAIGKYICFIDDDDTVSENYIKLLIEAANTDCDCSSLKGEITIDGGEPEIFEHSILYNKWETTNDTIKYLRFPNHLNMIRADIAKQFKFPEKNHGEDFDWSTMLHKSGLLKNEHYIPEVIYYYNYVSKK